jgi:large subunit ribosomal protein L6
VSRVGLHPITLPKGVDVKIDGSQVTVKGPLGTLSRNFHPAMTIALDKGILRVSRPNDERFNRSLHGLTRALLNNMVVGVSTGYEKALEIQGVGYRAQKSGDKLVIQIGFTHPVEMTPPQEVKVELTNPTNIKIKGINKEMVGEFAAQVRAVRRADPYKGKGIRYLGEHVRRKAGKAGKAVGGKK